MFKEDKLHLTSAGRLFQIELPLEVKVRFRTLLQCPQSETAVSRDRGFTSIHLLDA